MIQSTRRGLFGLTGGLLAGGLAMSGAAAPAADMPFAADPDARADDEAYWAKVAALYDRPADPDVVQLENGQFGAMARPVRLAFERKTEMVNRETTIYTRGPMRADARKVYAKVAALLDVGEDEMTLSRGTTESMVTLIGGYNRLRKGDAALYADVDYDSMQTAMQALARTRGARVVKIEIPEPYSRQGFIEAYDKAFRANPNLRMALVTHLSHRSGFIPPVREIADMARARGIDVILDGGHALGQTEFRLKDLGVDFAGLNLHKWIGAPLGVGVIYIRKERIPDIDVGLSAEPSDKIEARLETGTVNNATVLTVADAIDFQRMIGLAAKARRLRYLRDRWAETVRPSPRVEVLTPPDPALHAGLTSFRIKGVYSEADNLKLKQALWDRYKIMTVERAGLARGTCIRVTPSFINTPADMDRLVKAIGELSA